MIRRLLFFFLQRLLSVQPDKEEFSKCPVLSSIKIFWDGALFCYRKSQNKRKIKKIIIQEVSTYLIIQSWKLLHCGHSKMTDFKQGLICTIFQMLWSHNVPDIPRRVWYQAPISAGTSNKSQKRLMSERPERRKSDKLEIKNRTGTAASLFTVHL